MSSDIPDDRRRAREGGNVPRARRASAVLTAAIGVVALVCLGALAVGAVSATGIGSSPSGATQSNTILAAGEASGYTTIDGAGTITRSVDGEVTATAKVGDDQALAIAASDDETVVGGSSGVVTRYDAELEPTGTAAFDGRVVALASTESGIAVAYGYGQYAASYGIDILDADFTTIQEWTVPGTVTAMTTRAGGGLFVGGSSGQVFVVGNDGTLVCTGYVDFPVTAITVAADGTSALVGDDGGVLSHLGDDCAVNWATQTTASGIRSVATDGSTLFAGDDVGDVAVLSADGNLIASSRVATSTIRAFVLDGDRVLIVPADGSTATFTPAEAGRALPLAVIIGLAAVAVAAVVMVVWRIRHRHSRAAAALGRWLRRLWRNRLAYAFALPALAVIALFFYYPVADAVRVSFTNTNLATGTSQWVGLANYLQVIVEDRYFHRGLLNLIVFLVAALVKTFTIPLLCALLVFWLRNARHRSLYRVLLVLPVVVPDLVVTLLWKTIYQPEGGLLNATLEAIGLSDLQRVWLGDENTALFAVLFVGFPFMNAFAFLIFYGGLLQIDPYVFEAASLDGVGPLRRLIGIELPLLRPQAGILVFFATIGAIQGIASVFVLTRGGPNLSTYVPALEMYDKIGQGAIAYASTIGIVLALIILLLSALFRWRPRSRRQGALR